MLLTMLYDFKINVISNFRRKRYYRQWKSKRIITKIAPGSRQSDLDKLPAVYTAFEEYREKLPGGR
jgi:DICT domain-containing protein